VREAVQYLENQAELLKQKEPASEVRARMIYEAAWGCRNLAEAEVATLRMKMQNAVWDKLRDEAVRKAPPGAAPVPLAMPEVPLTAIPLQPSEQRARGHYQSLISGFADLPLAVDARFELAELYAERREHDAAVKLLREALDKEPSAELTEKIRLRLGAALAAKGDAKAALTQFQAVAGNAKSPYLGQARYRLGECYMQIEDWANAAKELTAFRDQPPFQNLPGLTDRALLRLGHALAHQKQWDQSRQAHELVVNRFGNSLWVHEARYGIGWAWQNQKQYDQAVNAFGQVASQTFTEVGAKAQFQIGLCLLEQKRYPEAATALLVVPFTYDYPELTAGALCEAARTFAEQKQPAQAIKLLERVLRDHPQSKWAEVARDRLQGLKGG
jgi:tetratricopeptide (TPR) repeat protein